MPLSTLDGLMFAEPQLGAAHAQSCKHVTPVSTGDRWPAGSTQGQSGAQNIHTSISKQMLCVHTPTVRTCLHAKVQPTWKESTELDRLPWMTPDRAG